MTDVLLTCKVGFSDRLQSTARDAFERGYELILVEDAMTGITAESHGDAVERIFPRIGRVRSTVQVYRRLRIAEAGEDESAAPDAGTQILNKFKF